MRGTLILGILSFVVFLAAKFGIGFLASGGCEPWTTCYYVMVSISYALAFIALSLAFKGSRRYIMDGIAGFFIGEAVNQYFYDGTYSYDDVMVYALTPVMFYFGSKFLSK